MMSCINGSLDNRQMGFVGGPPADLELWLFVDADFAGDRSDLKSTSGGFLVLVGPNTFFPLGYVCKKQTCQSHNTPEAEIVALDAGIRTEGIPALELWKVLLGREPRLRVWEDNEATIKIVKSGRFPAMRHVKRVHGVSVMSLHDNLEKAVFALEDCHTDV